MGMPVAVLLAPVMLMAFGEVTAPEEALGLVAALEEGLGLVAAPEVTATQGGSFLNEFLHCSISSTLFV